MPRTFFHLVSLLTFAHLYLSACEHLPHARRESASPGTRGYLPHSVPTKMDLSFLLPPLPAFNFSHADVLILHPCLSLLALILATLRYLACVRSCSVSARRSNVQSGSARDLSASRSGEIELVGMGFQKGKVNGSSKWTTDVTKDEVI